MELCTPPWHVLREALFESAADTAYIVVVGASKRNATRSRDDSVTPIAQLVETLEASPSKDEPIVTPKYKLIIDEEEHVPRGFLQVSTLTTKSLEIEEFENTPPLQQEDQGRHLQRKSKFEPNSSEMEEWENIPPIVTLNKSDSNSFLTIKEKGMDVTLPNVGGAMDQRPPLAIHSTDTNETPPRPRFRLIID